MILFIFTGNQIKFNFSLIRFKKIKNIILISVISVFGKICCSNNLNILKEFKVKAKLKISLEIQR